MLSLAKTYRGMLLKKIEKGCKLRLLLLNPENKRLMQTMALFASSYKVPAHTKTIRDSLTMLRATELFSTHLSCRFVFTTPPG